jgi:hypothetical protein
VIDPSRWILPSSLSEVCGFEPGLATMLVPSQVSFALMKDLSVKKTRASAKRFCN